MLTPQKVKVEQETPPAPATTLAPAPQTPQRQDQGQGMPTAKVDEAPFHQREQMSTREKYKALKRKYGELLQECTSLGEELFKARRYITKLEKERK